MEEEEAASSHSCSFQEIYGRIRGLDDAWRDDSGANPDYAASVGLSPVARAVYLEFWTLFYDPLVWQILFGVCVSPEVCWSLDSSGRRLHLFLFGAFLDSKVDTCTYVSSGGHNIIPAIPCVKVDFGSEVDSAHSTTALFRQLVVRCLSCLRNTGLLQLGTDDFKKMLRVRRCWLDSGYTVIRQFTELFVIRWIHGHTSA